jgi:outer membrane protein insertion porin family
MMLLHSCCSERDRRPSLRSHSALTTAKAFTVVLATTLLLSSLCPAQSFPLGRINISGSRRYTPQALAAALNLRTGQQTSQKQLEAASQRLTASGLFSNIEYRFGWAGDGAVVNFELRDNTNLIPVDFENFVWFTPNELATAIKRRLPLFTGVVPLSGDFNEQIIRALESILKSQKIEGRVVQIAHGSVNGAPQAMFYRVNDHQISINCCDFVGINHADPVALGEVARYIAKSPYEKSAVNTFIRTRLKEIYDSAGYLAAQIADPQVKISTQNPLETAIALSVQVTEGSHFKLAGVKWSGNHQFSSDELTAALSPALGEPANPVRLRDQLASVGELYSRRGYLRTTFEIVPQLKANGTATFVVQVKEGEQYRTGKVLFSGLDPRVADKALEAWTMKAGDIYDGTYPAQFMNHELNRVVPEDLEWEWTRREDIHEDAKSVDLYLDVTFKPRTP